MIVEGISRITPADFKNASVLGFGIKLLAVITRDFAKNELSVRVAPDAAARGQRRREYQRVFNAVSVKGDVVGTTFPTADAGPGRTPRRAPSSAAISRTPRRCSASARARISTAKSRPKRARIAGFAPPESIRSRYYLASRSRISRRARARGVGHGEHTT